MIVADASALIAHLESADGHHAAATEALLELADHPIGASTITLAEVLAAPATTARLEDAQTTLSLLGVRELALGTVAAGRLATLRAETGLKLPDCCVLLSARDSFAAGLLTFDARMASVARALGLPVFGAPA